MGSKIVVSTIVYFAEVFYSIYSKLYVDHLFTLLALW